MQLGLFEIDNGQLTRDNEEESSCPESSPEVSGAVSRWATPPCVDVAQAAAVSVALCQDVDRLASIDAWTYDVDVEAFRAYCVGRGVLYQFARPGARAWEYLRDCSLTVEDWLADEGVRHAQEHLGKRHRYTDEALRGHWDCVLIQRGKLQLCWELWAPAPGSPSLKEES